MRTNNNVLTSYVESIYVTNMGGPPPGTTNIDIFVNPAFVTTTLGPNQFPILTNDMNIVGLLSLPENDNRKQAPAGFPLLDGYTNSVMAVVRAMSGSALQQNGANSLTAFRYQINVENAPWYYNAFYTPLFTPVNTNNYVNFVSSMAHEVRLKFSWPLYELPNGTIQKLGEGRQTYRTVIGGHLYLTNSWGNYSLCFFQPGNYTTNTNGF
jgi:hypothetical protein